ncbi:PREDICTED: proline-rich protein 11 [Gavialis gangeticus]|uniref:proline-rich protein 11 n=1 Tax=Gavialis gangeticus TaxID=94835 RepID=UPI00092F25E3|nr:PREDICTED: proline-rich protein 11 [Gavialis gangeticus]
MAKYKQRQRKLRARAKLHEERRRRRSTAALLPCPAAPAPRSVDGPLPNTPCSQSHRFSVWNVYLPTVKNAVKPLVMTMSSICSWCQNSIAQSFEVIKDTIFPSRLYLRELNALRKEMQKLETEFSRLQGMLQMSGTVVRSSENSPCQRCNKPLIHAPVCACISLPELVSGSPTAVLQPAAALPPPPPPPPLPPPRPPPAPLLLKRVNGNKTPLAISVKKDGPIQITMKDLLNVKLKKTQPCTRPDKGGSPVKIRRALITVSDLQSINLRPKSNQPPARITNLLITPGKNQLDLRKHLKRVNIKRSPGGTPLNNKENMATGTGLTPIMTQALKRKFQMAHPKSPSPAPLHTASSFDEQN